MVYILDIKLKCTNVLRLWFASNASDSTIATITVYAVGYLSYQSVCMAHGYRLLI